MPWLFISPFYAFVDESNFFNPARQSDNFQYAFAFKRAVITPYTFATVLAPAFFSAYVMAVLIQLPRTKIYRTALLPVVFWLCLRAAMSLDFSWNLPGYDYLNKVLLMGMFATSLRSMAWVLNAKPTYTRLPICKPGNGTIKGQGETTPVSVSTAMWNAWDLMTNLRGIGWNGPPKVSFPAPYFHVESRSIFFLLSLSRTILIGVLFDSLCVFLCFLGRDSFGQPEGGTIFDPSLAPLERYTKSSIITLLVGACTCVYIELVYQLHAALFTVLFQQYPSQWPPLFDSPWSSTSLASFWSRRWHQILREVFVVVGSKPIERYFGRIGGILGAFVLSGVLHDIGMRGMSRYASTLPSPVMGFFILHGVGVVLEYALKQVTGRRVSGVIGLLWVYFAFILSGQIIVDAWAQSGVLASEFYPKAYSPTILFLNWMSRERAQF